MSLHTEERNGQVFVTTMLPPTDKLVDSSTAADVLCVPIDRFYVTFCPGTNYHEVRRVLRGSNGKKSARGQGHLFHIDDLREIHRISQAAGLRMGIAARVFAAKRKGLI